MVDRRDLLGTETGDGEFLLGRRNTSLRYLILIICLSLMLSQILLLIYSICRFELLSIASTLLHERDLYFSEFSDSFILHVWRLKTSWGWWSSADQDTLNGKTFLILTKNSWREKGVLKIEASLLHTSCSSSSFPSTFLSLSLQWRKERKNEKVLWVQNGTDSYTIN